MKSLRHIYRLGLKELISFSYDLVLVVLLVYCFTFMVIVPSISSGLMRNSTVAIIDEDQTPLSTRISAAIGKPYFQKPRMISYHDIDHALDRGRYTFLIDIPPGFQKGALSGKTPEILIDVDATAVGHAKVGTTYLAKIIRDEVVTYLYGPRKSPDMPVRLNVRTKYNPNRQSKWFMSLVFLTQMITLLSILLPAAALMKEKERGTVEHLLVMPLKPFEISLAKVWSNSFIIVIGSLLSLIVCVKGVIGTPVIGSVPLFFAGTLVYLFATTELGILLATVARNLPQVGLLCMPIVVPMVILAGGTTPIESMPLFLQKILTFSPTVYYLKFITAVLLKDAALADVWPQLSAMTVIGIALFTAALMRLRSAFR